MRCGFCALHAGKTAHPTQRAAEIVKQAMRHKGRAGASDLAIFTCQECALWFLGSKKVAKAWRRERLQARREAQP